ncbi:hypothetical protein [Rhizobium sp. MHM7A]|uniref:hypothetical protein n=1 Tax=Rhizobium sp. MHM7A TaxID=2583233 RepID=UPI001106D19F|nr:hypothetical protein [Rhizobium sp. MHM7A]TLX16134.1 hypothetical protein FFR93_02075 [Rhizobium sp. MHM7A]
MEQPKSITIPLTYDAQGRLNDASFILALESALQGRLRITDWYGEEFASSDFPHLSQDERLALLGGIEVGEWGENVIDPDAKREQLEIAAARVDVDLGPSASELGM